MDRFRSSMRPRTSSSPQCVAMRRRWSFRKRAKRSRSNAASGSKTRSARFEPGAAKGDRDSRLGLVRLLRGDTGDVAAGNSNVGQFAVAQLGKFLHGEPISLPVLEKANNR